MSRLFFLVLPRITPFYFEDNPVHSGQSVQVTCFASEGDLPLKFSWKFNGEKLEDYPEISTATVGKRMFTLLIDSVSYSHAGNYTCVVANDAGEATFNAELQVNG